jgi:hypothetical protein
MVTRLVACAAAVLGTLCLGGVASAHRSQHIQISAPSRVKQHQVYDVTIRGFSRRRATAYLFVDYSGCARSLGVEKNRASGESDSYSVKGSFAEVSGWKSSSTGVDHACAYLVAGGGQLLSRAKVAFTVR